MDHLTCGLELKLAGNESDVETMSFEGYGAVFGAVDLGGDLIVKGAFRDTIREAKKTGVWPDMLFLHGWYGGGDEAPIGVWEDLEEDDKGLFVKGRLAGTTRGKEAYELLKMAPRPAISGLSIGYSARDVVFGKKPDEPRRTLKKIDLFEISLVKRPMQPSARVSAVKNINPRELQELEDALRDVGFSQTSRKKAASVFRKFLQRDVGVPGNSHREDGPSGNAMRELREAVRTAAAKIGA